MLQDYLVVDDVIALAFALLLFFINGPHLTLKQGLISFAAAFCANPTFRPESIRQIVINNYATEINIRHNIFFFIVGVNVAGIIWAGTLPHNFDTLLNGFSNSTHIVLWSSEQSHSVWKLLFTSALGYMLSCMSYISFQWISGIYGYFPIFLVYYGQAVRLLRWLKS